MTINTAIIPQRVGQVYDPLRGCWVPSAIARLAAGKDAYLRNCSAKCSDCGDVYILRNAESDELCNSCFDKAGDENAVSDGHMTQEEFDARWGK